MSNDPVFLSNVRLSFPHLMEPHSASDKPDAKKQYQADLILNPNDSGWNEFVQRVQNIANAKWDEHASAVLNLISQDRRLRCYGRGEERINKKTMQPLDGYAGNVFIGGKRDIPIQMIKPDGSACDPENTMLYKQLAGKMYGGCYVNAALRPWVQDNQHGRAIRCEIIALQFAKDGEPFGEAVTDASGMFKPVAAAPAGFSPAGGTAQPQAAPFGAAQTPADPGMPAAPFPAPGLPGFLGGGN